LREVIRQLGDVFLWNNRQLNRWLLGWTVVENVAAERPVEMADALGLVGDNITSVTVRHWQARREMRVDEPEQVCPCREFERPVNGRFGTKGSTRRLRTMGNHPDRVMTLFVFRQTIGTTAPGTPGGLKTGPKEAIVSDTTQISYPQSACLISQSMTDAGVGELLDIVPIDSPTQAGRSRSIRRTPDLSGISRDEGGRR
jgi:hypothetical protein